MTGAGRRHPGRWPGRAPSVSLGMTNAVSQTRLLLVALIALLAAGNGWTQPAAVDVTAGSAVTLSDALWYWAPPAEHDWSAPPGPANFQPLRHQAMPPGITRLWLLFRLTNTDSVPRERILSMEELLFERLRLRAPPADGSWQIGRATWWGKQYITADHRAGHS